MKAESGMLTAESRLCPGCGALVPNIGGSDPAGMHAAPGCYEAYGRLGALHYADYDTYFEVYRLAVSAYPAQHPGDPGPQTARFIGGHLFRLCLMLERGADSATANSAIVAFTNATKRSGLPWLTPPAHRGDRTIFDVLATTAPAAHQRELRRWAASVWQAWAAHHGVVRGWVDAAGW